MLYYAPQVSSFISNGVGMVEGDVLNELVALGLEEVVVRTYDDEEEETGGNDWYMAVCIDEKGVAGCLEAEQHPGRGGKRGIGKEHLVCGPDEGVCPTAARVFALGEWQTDGGVIFYCAEIEGLDDIHVEGVEEVEIGGPSQDAEAKEGEYAVGEGEDDVLVEVVANVDRGHFGNVWRLWVLRDGVLQYK